MIALGLSHPPPEIRDIFRDALPASNGTDEKKYAFFCAPADVTEPLPRSIVGKRRIRQRFWSLASTGAELGVASSALKVKLANLTYE